MLLFATLLCSSKTLSYTYLNTSYNTEIALNRLNNDTYFLITLITNSEKFLVVDSSKYVIVLNNNSIIQLQPIKNIITKTKTNKVYAVYYLTNIDISNIIIHGVKQTYQYTSNGIIYKNFSYNEFSKYIIVEVNNILHHTNF